MRKTLFNIVKVQSRIAWAFAFVMLLALIYGALGPNGFNAVTKAAPKSSAASYNAKLPKPPMLRGIPAALAKARETRYAQKTNGVATVSVEVNATKGNRPKE